MQLQTRAVQSVLACEHRSLSTWQSAAQEWAHLQNVIACEVRPAGVPVRLPCACRLCLWHCWRLRPCKHVFVLSTNVVHCFLMLGRHPTHC